MIDSIKQAVKTGGVNVIDSELNYRYMKSERCVGKALQDLFADGYSREEFFISTKGGYISKDADRPEFS